MQRIVNGQKYRDIRISNGPKRGVKNPKIPNKIIIDCFRGRTLFLMEKIMDTINMRLLNITSKDAPLPISSA